MSSCLAAAWLCGERFHLSSNGILSCSDPSQLHRVISGLSNDIS